MEEGRTGFIVKGLEDAVDAVRRVSELSRERCREVFTSNEQFNDWLNRSIADLRTMQTDTAHGQHVYAGIPWYSTAFGRDGIITALECLWFNPDMARGGLMYLAATQAAETDAEQDAQPGKVLHETRAGEMAALGEVPFGRYYGAVDATPLFVMLAGAYYRRKGDLSFAESIWPNVERALERIDTHGDADGDGFVEYARRSRRGLVQQGWKDSQDAVFHADGSSAEPPIALCEVQGYVYTAKVAAGLARYGLKAEAVKILTGLFDASLFFDLHRLPELFCGFPRRPGESPTLYPVSCAPQAWASGAVFLLLQACLGLEVQGSEGKLVLTNPLLPDFLDRIKIAGLHVGEAGLDRWHDRVVKELAPGIGSADVLDAGCATGRLLLALSNAGARSVSGVDLAPRILQVAREKLTANGVTAELRAADLEERIPWPDASFDVVTLTGVLHHLFRPREALQEIARVLRKEGRLVLVEFRLPSPPRQMVNLCLRVRPVAGDCRFYSSSAVAGMFSDLGWTHISSSGVWWSGYIVCARRPDQVADPHTGHQAEGPSGQRGGTRVVLC